MNKKVMIIDDEKDFLEELSHTLILCGYNVVTVDNPLKAVDIAKNINPDIVLVNIKMPAKNGLLIASELKYFFGFNYVPIIGMTGFYKDEELQLMNICGIQKCLKKPFQPLDIIYSIEKAIEC